MERVTLKIQLSAVNGKAKKEEIRKQLEKYLHDEDFLQYEIFVNREERENCTSDSFGHPDSMTVTFHSKKCRSCIFGRFDKGCKTTYCLNPNTREVRLLNKDAEKDCSGYAKRN